MLSKKVVIKGKKEAERAIPLLVQAASGFESKITFTHEEKTVNVKSIMGMINFGIVPDREVLVTVEGEDEAEAMERMESFLTTD